MPLVSGTQTSRLGRLTLECPPLCGGMRYYRGDKIGHSESQGKAHPRLYLFVEDPREHRVDHRAGSSSVLSMPSTKPALSRALSIFTRSSSIAATIWVCVFGSASSSTALEITAGVTSSATPRSIPAQPDCTTASITITHKRTHWGGILSSCSPARPITLRTNPQSPPHSGFGRRSGRICYVILTELVLNGSQVRLRPIRLDSLLLHPPHPPGPPRPPGPARPPRPTRSWGGVGDGGRPRRAQALGRCDRRRG